ncbi:hypothetical protein RCL_jg13013.t2 [Rhizophagus clarus]|uniref:Uncharacterized protein n=1 Tax=Rhizophagus clarus TaxID=94130 RepID=A0A8H3KW78_9GLOM|nr:hypothetical protein RCL_jg13013.t2 [Rhizophagus clarus]
MHNWRAVTDKCSRTRFIVTFWTRFSALQIVNTFMFLNHQRVCSGDELRKNQNLLGKQRVCGRNDIPLGRWPVLISNIGIQTNASFLKMEAFAICLFFLFCKIPARFGYLQNPEDNFDTRSLIST